MNRLIILMGTSCSGKSTIANELEKNGYQKLNFDEIIHELYPHRSNQELLPQEIQDAYHVLGQRANEILKHDKLVVDEWFYLDNSFDWFKEKIDDFEEGQVHFFELDADLDTILERYKTKTGFVPEEIVIKNYNLTHDHKGVYYRTYKPIVVDTKDKSIEYIVNYIITQLDLTLWDRARQKTKDQPQE